MGQEKNGELLCEVMRSFDIDAKMKGAASAALAEKSECLAKLQAEIEELKAKI